MTPYKNFLIWGVLPLDENEARCLKRKASYCVILDGASLVSLDKTQDRHIPSRSFKGSLNPRCSPLVSLASPKACQTQGLPLVSLTSPKARQTQGSSLVSLRGSSNPRSALSESRFSKGSSNPRSTLGEPRRNSIGLSNPRSALSEPHQNLGQTCPWSKAG
ncbi:hypothetical protein JHK82_031726 [Glycine max]|nr:hypothetical protein JHK85_032389 [Glycine max]KAG4994992.1 hypothetical protein JHK86_031819 [Glycine max]KAG5124989.1 hypothetical protein JHK82_031726 [Glycine max]